VTIVASSGGKLFLVPLQSVVFFRIWREVSFWFLLSQQLLWPHLAGSCFWFLFSQLFFAASCGMFFLVPFKSAFIVVSSGGKLFWFLFSHFFLLHLAGICFWFLLSQHPLMPHLAGS
jgi:hypothetical protein